MLTRDQIADIYPLTAFQEGVLLRDWLERQADSPDSPTPRAYAMQLTFRLSGPLNLPHWEQAWQGLIDRHDMLRTVFPSTFRDRPLQVVLKNCAMPMALERIDSLDEAARVQTLALRAAIIRQRPIELDRPPLMRVTCLRFAQDDHGVIWDFHHILLDGWCIGLIQQELATLYAAACDGATPRLSKPLAYSRYANWLDDRRRRSEPARWSACLTGAPDQACALPGRRAGAAVSTRRPQCQSRRLSPKVAEALRGMAAAQGCTLGDALIALWGVFLCRVTGQADVLFGSVRSLRPPELDGVQEMVGPCIGMIPVRVTCPDDATPATVLRHMAPQRAVWLEQPADALPDILQACGLQRDAVGHFLVYENYPAIDSGDGSQQPLSHGVGMSGWSYWALNDYDFFVRFSPADVGGLRVDLEFDAQAFDGNVISSLADSLAVFTGNWARRHDAPLPQIALMDDDNLKAVTQTWALGAPAASGGAAPRGFASTWIGVVQAQQGRAALRWDGHALNYADVHRGARLVSEHLLQRGAAPGDIVALAALPGPWMVLGMLGCAFLGLPYIPLDPQWPDEHRRSVLRDCGSRLRFGPVPPHWRLDQGIIDVDTPLPDAMGCASHKGSFDGQVPAPIDTRGTAYVIYTSGTTGAPKGVAVGMDSLLNYTAWLRDDLGIGPDSASILLSSAAYDLGYTALFGTLLNGGCLTLLNEDQRRDPDVVVRRIMDDGLTFLKTTPSFFSMLQSSHAWQALDPSRMKLQRLLLGGQAQDFESLARLKRQFPQVLVHNHYGPTEATVGCVAGPLDDLVTQASPPQRLGRPIPGALVLVVDRHMQPVPPGVVGELLVGGTVLAQGYLGMAARTAGERFIDWPCTGAQRCYRTGDLAAWSRDGQLIFHGRVDDQVKVQGYRVHLADIAAAVRQLQGVVDAAVLLDGIGPDQVLQAYVVAGSHEEPAAARDWRSELQSHLAKPLLPGRWFRVDRITLTANGKVDRAALRAQARSWPMGDRATDANSAVATANAVNPAVDSDSTLGRILHTFRQTLGHEGLGVHDDFFEHGGHSLKAIRLAAQLRRILNRPVPITLVFDHPTPAGLARQLDQAETAPTRAALRLFKDSPVAACDLVFFPTLVGTALQFKNVSALIPESVRVWGLDCPSTEPDGKSAASILAIAEQLFEALRVAGLLDKNGADCHRPLVLVGWSFGAYLAFEVAKLWAPHGARRTVALVLIDIPAPAAAVAPGMVKSPSAEESDLQADALKTGLQLEAAETQALRPVVQRHMAALSQHRVTGAVDCEMLLLEASESSPPTAMAGWTNWTGRVATHRMLLGTHYSVVSPDNHARLVQAVLPWVLGLVGGAQTDLQS